MMKGIGLLENNIHFAFGGNGIAAIDVFNYDGGSSRIALHPTVIVDDTVQCCL